MRRDHRGARARVGGNGAIDDIARAEAGSLIARTVLHRVTCRFGVADGDMVSDCHRNSESQGHCPGIAGNTDAADGYSSTIDRDHIIGGCGSFCGVEIACIGIGNKQRAARNGGQLDHRRLACCAKGIGESDRIAACRVRNAIIDGKAEGVVLVEGCP